MQLRMSTLPSNGEGGALKLETSIMLNEEAIVPEAALPIAAFKAHLRLGTGFAEETVQDAVLGSFLRAALAAIEARTAKALIQRSFSWSVTRWRSSELAQFPLSPVNEITEVRSVDKLGVEEIVDPASYALSEDLHHPKLVSTGASLPAIPSFGKIVVRFEAGFAADWDGLPADLAQAVFLLAAHYYEYRDETTLAPGCMPFGVQSLIERYRPMRLFSGGAA